MAPDSADDSSPCFAHRFVDGHLVDPETARDVARFRRAERARLMDLRREISPAERAAMSAGIAGSLRELVSLEERPRIAAYWPIRGEPDLRGWMKNAHEAGARILLPVVVQKNAPLEFRPWTPGCAMGRGIWNIPVPTVGPGEVPDVVVVPLVGVDEEGFRLGNGGGYYDRTLARLDPRPRVIGVGFSCCRIRTIYPMPWDIPMPTIVLGDGAIREGG